MIRTLRCDGDDRDKPIPGLMSRASEVAGSVTRSHITRDTFASFRADLLTVPVVSGDRVLPVRRFVVVQKRLPRQLGINRPCLMRSRGSTTARPGILKAPRYRGSARTTYTWFSLFLFALVIVDVSFCFQDATGRDSSSIYNRITRDISLLSLVSKGTLPSKNQRSARFFYNTIFFL